MKILLKIFFLFFFFLIINPVLLYAQSFEKNVLIDIPGDNYDFDLLSNYFSPETFITWINKNDSTYTVFLKRISPNISDSNIVISSGRDVKSKPKVVWYNRGIKIVWQNYTDNFFRIVSRNYLNNSLSNEIIIQDSLTSEPLISLSTNRICWISNNKLFIKELDPVISSPMLIDSAICTSPNILKEDIERYTQILYERIENENHQICLAEFNDYLNPKWSYSIISDGNNRNSNFGIERGISFEKIENNISKIKYSGYETARFYITHNISCNYKNPNVFSYPVPTKSFNNKTPFFVAFDSDSLENNKEIFIETFYFGSYDSLINISNMAGDDYKPKVCYIDSDDTIYAAVIWQHQNNSKTDIWIAKEVFNPIITSVKDKNINIKSFGLLQNYPNPFNPSTKIKYTIPNVETRHASSLQQVTLKIYDTLGNEIATLVNEEKPAGSYEIEFDASGLSSGVYFYSIKVNGIQKTKSMVLLK